MRVLLLGATGSIGRPVLRELIENGHSVLALARSETAEGTLRREAADVLRGDLREPAPWTPAVREVDAIIHTAATFTDDMAKVDRGVMDALIAEAAASTAGGWRNIWDKTGRFMSLAHPCRKVRSRR